MSPNLDLDKGDKELLSLLFVIVVHRPATLVDYSKNYYIKRLLYMHTSWPSHSVFNISNNAIAILAVNMISSNLRQCWILLAKGSCDGAGSGQGGGSSAGT